MDSLNPHKMRGGPAGFNPQSEPKVNSVDLHPKSPTNQTGSATIAYLSGDIPYLVLHLAQRTHRLKLGDCFPTGGKPCALENPFSRGGQDLSIGFDFPLTIGSAGWGEFREQQGATVTYYGASFYSNAGDGNGFPKGVGFMQTKGSALYHIRSSSNASAYVLPNVKSEFMGLKPAGFMEEGIDIKHTSGDELPSVSSIGGFYTEQGVMDWFAAAEYDAAKMHFILQDYPQTEIILEEGTALLVVGLPDKPFEANVRITDYGDPNGEAYV